MVIGKLFLIILTTNPALVRAQGASHGDSVTGPMIGADNIPQLIYNWSVWNGGLLEGDDKVLYRQALMVMLENMQNGEVMDWSSARDPGVRGRMRVVWGYQTSNGYCRVYQSSIQKHHRATNLTETACKSAGRAAWTFYNK